MRPCRHLLGLMLRYHTPVAGPCPLLLVAPVMLSLRTLRLLCNIIFRLPTMSLTTRIYLPLSMPAIPSTPTRVALRIHLYPLHPSLIFLLLDVPPLSILQKMFGLQRLQSPLFVTTLITLILALLDAYIRFLR